MAIVSSDPYTYAKYVVEQSVPGHYPRSGGYSRTIPPGFSDFVPMIFGVAVTAHPSFQFELVTEAGAVAVPIQPAPSGPQVPVGCWRASVSHSRRAV
ncbi:MAG: hypothetical protein E6J41_26230 [Chloroflexi bacterium]|nr:MAG: hypothetical protein E6J41_26230 [Chloroflexota bacterium]